MRNDDNANDDVDGCRDDASIVASDYDARDGAPPSPPLAREEGEAQECQSSLNKRLRHQKQ